MGVEYEHYLIPTRPLQRPSAERILRLIEAMRDEGWISKSPRYRSEPHTFVARGESGKLPAKLTAAWLRDRRAALRLTWTLSEASRYPLTRLPYLRDGMYWDLEIHWSRHYLPATVPDLDHVTALKTDCGDRIVRGSPFFSKEVPFTRWLIKTCPSCKGEVNVPGLELSYHDPWTTSSRPVTGAGIHRFALRIDCGKSVPEDTGKGPVRVHPDLVRLAEKHLACTFHDDIGRFC
jgi:hypothetical protein